MSGSAKSQLGAISSGQLLVAFSIVAYAIYFPALAGEFVSDDIHYVAANPYIQELSPEHVVAILDPSGPLPRVVENYAPVHLLLHGVVWQAFGEDVRGHHLVNIVMHALASLLLVHLFRRTGIPPLAALLGGAFFLVHPANVEAVAWVNQLKTTSAMVLCVAAVLAHPRRPLLAVVAFALALLAKPTAAVAPFVVVALGWARSRGDGSATGPDAAPAAPPDWRWRWLAAWCVVLIVFAVLEFGAFGQTAGQHKVLYPELALRVRTTVAVALRYLVMATTSYGTSVFQEPGPAASWLDPWWLAALPVLFALGWRAFFALRTRRAEAAYWVWAVVSFAPICGLIPLPHIIADRYLYFMLPGLIGGALFVGGALFEQRAPAARRRALTGILAAVAVVCIGVFGLRSHARAGVWVSSETITADVIAHYPEGRWAQMEFAARAAAAGRAAEAVEHLLAARARGFDKLDVLLGPRYAALGEEPQFVALKRELAGLWIERVEGIAKPTQSDLMFRAQAYIVVGDLEGARNDLRNAIYVGGPMTDYLYGALDQLAALERRRDASEPPAGAP